MDLIPKPRDVQFGSGSLLLPERPGIEASPPARGVAAQLQGALGRHCGMRPELLEESASRAATIVLELDARIRGAEAYVLEVDAARARVRAGALAGLFYGCQSLAALAGSGRGRLPLGRIIDEPRFPWRGAHLDVGRHFFPVEFIKRYIDLLALHKLNVFHWHLTEDQGWRVAIDAFPRLTELSAWRERAGRSYGGFYTKDQVREVVAYAAERFVEVVPEIEMPGHALAALAAYPELSCSGGPFEVETTWGIFDDVFCAGNEETFAFLERVLTEVVELFPSCFVHIGGDECPKIRWQGCAKCQGRMRQEGLGSEEELQSWFVRRMGSYLESLGKRLVGWDEILEGGLAPGAVVMSWRGVEGGIAAARQGHDVIMSPMSACYLDYRQRDGEGEPGAIYAEPLLLEAVYGYEPIPPELSREQGRRVLGVQANVWTEWMQTPAEVEYMAFPRLCALSEVAWSPAERDFADFERRLAAHRRVLDMWEVAYCGSPRACPPRTRPVAASASPSSVVVA